VVLNVLLFLLQSAEDLRQIRRERSLLARFKRARRYDKDTGEVLHIIEVSRELKILRLERESDILFVCPVQCMLAQAQL
jgi:hypothetical protein